MTTAGRGSGRNGAAVKIVVTGPFGAGKTTLLATISETSVLSTERPVSGGSGTDGAVTGAVGKAQTTVAMDFGRLTFAPDLVLHLFGTPGQERFSFMWEVLGEGMLGYVVLVDAGRPDSLQEAGRIRQAFREMTGVPFVVALNRCDGLDVEGEAAVRRALDLAGDTPVVPCDARDRESVKDVLLALLHAVAARLDDVPAGV